MPESNDNFTTNALLIILLGIAGVAIFGSFFQNIAGLYRDFLANFYAQKWHPLFLFLKILIIGIDILLLGFMGYTGWLYRQLLHPSDHAAEKTISLPPEDVVTNEWGEINRLASSENASDRNMAVLRADALMENTLHQLGYEGATFADRLRLVSPVTLPSIDALWSAHRIRNIIAHDPVEKHAPAMLKEALSAYARALQELHMMPMQSSPDSVPPQG
ncbi:MAG: hypothetical protein G01um101466_208 [Parcubacteria group bacterium Gr01-1014_66]|nr:MAG: hypothetical protein G01um101466_208 [Parcubacteria group bacterium Gr01-1014_66]